MKHLCPTPSQKDRFATLGYSDLMLVMLVTKLLTILMFLESSE
ncbi:hypothetical protein VCHA49P379_110087 [Vibrio chagasii]|nr:hypothetical protein VCHA49P379_110087 [Vibrio chagasii]